MNGLDLYGSKGGPASVINVMPDESQQCLVSIVKMTLSTTLVLIMNQINSFRRSFILSFQGNLIQRLTLQLLRSLKATIIGNVIIDHISKETDAGLLGIVSYPAFAVDDPELIALTKTTILEKLKVRSSLDNYEDRDKDDDDYDDATDAILLVVLFVGSIRHVQIS